MAVNPRSKMRPLDQWSTRERLALASSVKKSGDQNWVSVSRGAKVFAEEDRTTEWFSHKNCALQYSHLLETIQTPKRKRAEVRDPGNVGGDTPQSQLVHRLTVERIEQLKQIIQDEENKYKRLKQEVECIRNGNWDHKVPELVTEYKLKQTVVKSEVEVKTEPADSFDEKPSVSELSTRIQPSLKVKSPTSSNLDDNEDTFVVIQESPETVISCKEEETVSDSEDLLRSQNNMINVNGDIIKLENTIQGADLITSGTDVTVECSQVENIIDLKEETIEIDETVDVVTEDRQTEPTVIENGTIEQTVISDEEVVSSEIEVETVPIDSIDINTIPVIDDDVEIIGETVVESEVIEHIPIEDSPLEGASTVIIDKASSNNVSKPEAIEVSEVNIESEIIHEEVLIESDNIITLEDEDGKTDAEQLIETKNIVQETSDNMQKLKNDAKDISQSLKKSKVTNVQKYLSKENAEDTDEDVVVDGPGDTDIDEIVRDKVVPNGTTMNESNVDGDNTIQEPVVPQPDCNGKPVTSAGKPRVKKSLSADKSAPGKSTPGKSTPAKSTPAQSTTAKSIPDKSTPAKSTPAKSTPAKSTPAKSTPAKSTPAKSTPAKSTPAESTPAESIPDKSTSAKSIPDKSTSAKSTPAKSTPAKSTPAKSTPDKSTPAKSFPAKSTPAESTTAKSIPDKSTPAKSFPAKSIPDKSIPDKSTPAKSFPAKSIPDKSTSAKSIPDKSTPAKSIPDKSTPAKSTDKNMNHEIKSTGKLTYNHVNQSVTPTEKKKRSNKEVDINKPAETKEDREVADVISGAVKNQFDTTDDNTIDLLTSVDPSPATSRACDTPSVEEPLSPASSVVSEVDSSSARLSIGTKKPTPGGKVPSVTSGLTPPTTGGKGPPTTGGKLGRRSNRIRTKIGDDDKHVDSSGDESNAADCDDMKPATPATPASLMGGTGGLGIDSVPNSPASISHLDTEDEKAHKAWKKSIMLVWRNAANHKYANIFMHPVTDDIAPGYSSVVYRPINLSMIKKNIEKGLIRTTSEFQRDMMLMFTNAIMYNNKNQDVYQMAETMYNDSMAHLELYVNTQMMVQSEPKVLRMSRRSLEVGQPLPNVVTSLSTPDKDEDKKRRHSTDIDQDPKIKKKRN